MGHCQKRWSIDSLLPIHKVQQSDLRDLKGLLTRSKSLVSTILLVTNQPNAIAFDGAFDFQWLHEGNRKKDLTKNESKGYDDQVLTSRDDNVKLTLMRIDRIDISLSKSSIFELVGFRQKLRFQVRGKERSRIDEIG